MLSVTCVIMLLKVVVDVIEKYSRADILQKLENTAQDMSVFYQQGFVNYRGCTSDTGEYYTEVAAQWCCEHLSELNTIMPITRGASYRVETHDGIPDSVNSSRIEELIAMAIFRQRGLPPLGRVLDYQTPLKNKRADRAGKIDLLTYDGETVRILELKKPDSQETMLRCVLEGHTYLRTLDHKKLLRDFSLPEDTVIRASPLVFLHGAQWQEAQQDRPQLFRLMELLDCKAYYIRQANGIYIVEE